MARRLRPVAPDASGRFPSCLAPATRLPVMQCSREWNQCVAAARFQTSLFRYRIDDTLPPFPHIHHKPPECWPSDAATTDSKPPPVAHSNACPEVRQFAFPLSPKTAASVNPLTGFAPLRFLSWLPFFPCSRNLPRRIPTYVEQRGWQPTESESPMHPAPEGRRKKLRVAHGYTPAPLRAKAAATCTAT